MKPWAPAPCSNEEYRKRRDPLNSFFSRRNILQVEEQVQDEVDKFVGQLDRVAKSGEPPDVSLAARAIALDVITNLCFEFSNDAINRDDLGAPFIATLENLIHFWMLNVYLPRKAIVYAVTNLAPGWLLEKMDPGMSDLERLVASKLCRRSHHPAMMLTPWTDGRRTSSEDCVAHTRRIGRVD